MFKNKKLIKTITTMFVFVFSFMLFHKSYSSITNGLIDATNKYAYSENAGWINFADLNSTIHITDTELTGYAYNENTGWISLNCSNTNTCSNNNFKVSNTYDGILSGYAYGENIGWINFSGVTINSSGEFSGYAYNENIGYISFNCLNTNTCINNDYKVTTDWRPFSVRPAIGSNTGSSSIPPYILESMNNNQNQNNQGQQEESSNEQEENNANQESNNNQSSGLNFWTDGRFIKLEDDDTIYFVDSSNIKHEYPDTHTWESYYGDDFSNVETVSKQELNNYLTGDDVPHKIDSLIKTPSSPKVYKVTENKVLRWIINENVATRLFGNAWNKLVRDISEIFFKDYTIGENIE
jgi:hypothetical protein